MFSPIYPDENLAQRQKSCCPLYSRLQGDLSKDTSVLLCLWFFPAQSPQRGLMSTIKGTEYLEFISMYKDISGLFICLFPHMLASMERLTVQVCG